MTDHRHTITLYCGGEKMEATVETQTELPPRIVRAKIGLGLYYFARYNLSNDYYKATPVDVKVIRGSKRKLW
jgi:hypothetical protein